MKKGQKARAPEPSPQIGVRITPNERRLMTRLIAVAERKASLAPGTITPAGYVRSALLAYMAQALKDLGPEGEADAKDPGVWHRLRENVAAMEETARPKR